MNYEEKWNELSWKMQEATTAFSAILGWMDYQKEFLESLQHKTTYPITKFQHAEIAISHALVSHFFISICHIRESTSNGKYSLSALYNEALNSNLLNSTQLDDAKILIESTQVAFNIIKNVRGQFVAHLNSAGNPFQVLKDKGLSRAAMQNYLNECNELFALLGEAIGKNLQHKKIDYKNELYQQMYELHSQIQPLNS